jgi:hypothetical protein
MVASVRLRDFPDHHVRVPILLILVLAILLGDRWLGQPRAETKRPIAWPNSSAERLLRLLVDLGPLAKRLAKLSCRLGQKISVILIGDR